MRITIDIPIKLPLFLFKKRKEREQKINKEMEELEKRKIVAEEKHKQWVQKKN